jgi:mRNA interferase YafQ
LQYVLKKETFEILDKITKALIAGEKLDNRFRDHQLQGNYSDYRLCHVTSDILLVYRVYSEHLTVELSDISSHSKLFKR